MLWLLVISAAFAPLGYVGRRSRLAAVPIVGWVLVAWLESRGILPGTTGLDSALLAGVLGALAVLAGVWFRARGAPEMRGVEPEPGQGKP